MTKASTAQGLLVHNVYFTLKDPSPESRVKLIRACENYLVDHPGVVFFACGPLAEALHREVNDRAFDVGLHVVFENQASHDHYQEAPAHLRFIEENRNDWAQVRVFDTLANRSV